MRVLLDTNVIIDVLQKREPWFSDAQKIIYEIANCRITGCITAKEATDIYYITRKQFVGQSNIDTRVRMIMTKLFSLLELVDTLGVDCENAIVRHNNDYEDAVMIESAIRSQIDYIVTRNTDDYSSSPIPVLTPSEFVRKLLN